MATPSTGRPILPTMKKSILTFIDGLVSKSIYRAIEIILSPCCTTNIVSISHSLVTTGVYNITVTLDQPTTLLNKGFAYLLIGNAIYSGPVSFTDGNTIQFSHVHIPNGTYNASLLINMAATNSGATFPYVGFNTPTFSVTFP